MTDSQHHSRGPKLVKLGRSTSSGEDGSPVFISLRREATGSPWGFRMLGGRDQETCLYIQKVNHKSIAERSGLRPGDGILSIAGVPADRMTHDQAKMEILRAGNELDFCVQRNVVPDAARQQNQRQQQRSEIDEDSFNISTGYQNPNVQSRSFRILQQTLVIDPADVVE